MSDKLHKVIITYFNGQFYEGVTVFVNHYDCGGEKEIEVKVESIERE